MKHLVLTGLLFISATPVSAKNYALFFSGVDNEKQDKNQFLKNYQQNLGNFSKNGWETQVMYGEPSEAEYFLKQTPAAEGKVKNASRENILAYLDEMIKNGESGDQLLMNLNGHGTITQKFEIEGTLLSYEDKDLITKFKALNDKGIKIAVSMDTCYGGGAIPSLAPYACVVSSQTNNMVSYAGAPTSSFKKALDATTPQSMNDYYLNLLAATSLDRRMVPVHSGAYDDDYLARVYTGFYRKADQYPAGPHESCYGPEAMASFEKGITSILGVLNSTQKYQKVCKVFGAANCKKQSIVLSSLKKLKLKDLDALNSGIEALSNEKMKNMDKCWEANDPSFNQTFKMKLDLKNLVKLPLEEYPGYLISLDMKKIAPNLKFEDASKSGTALNIPFKGNFCSVSEFLSSESINDMANTFAKDYFMGANVTFKATSAAQLAEKFKIELKKSFLKTLTPEQQTKITTDKDLIKSQYAANKKYLDVLKKIQNSYSGLDSGLIHQALAYSFLDESENISEKDKAGRKKCANFKLK